MCCAPRLSLLPPEVVIFNHTNLYIIKKSQWNMKEERSDYSIPTCPRACALSLRISHSLRTCADPSSTIPLLSVPHCSATDTPPPAVTTHAKTAECGRCNRTSLWARQEVKEITHCYGQSHPYEQEITADNALQTGYHSNNPRHGLGKMKVCRNELSCQQKHNILLRVITKDKSSLTSPCLICMLYRLYPF